MPRSSDAAREQVGITTTYDPAYRKLAYPGGDVPMDTGVCCDVVVRALRSAYRFDLQQKVHEDMRAGFAAYPQKWGLKKPDANIDHRRVPNQAKFFARQGQVAPISTDPGAYLPGDLVTWRLPIGVPHIGIVSERHSDAGTPLVIHNIGAGAVEENILFSFTITGHYRYLPQQLAEACKRLK